MTPNPYLPTNDKEAAFPGFKELLMGPSGTGKTTSIATLVETGMEVFYLDLDRSLETLVGYWSDRGMPIPANLRYHYLNRNTQGFKALMGAAEAVGKFDLSTLAKMKDHERGIHNQLVSVLEILNDFPDQRTGQRFGPVDSWGNERVLVIDSMTALNKIVFDMVVGTRVMRDKPDYGIAQNLITNLITRLTDGCITNFVMTAHIERQTDEVLGGIKLMPVTIGNATKAELPIPFSDVILSVRNGTEWNWDTANGQADLKARNLPYSSKLKPDFGQVVTRWNERRKAAGKA